MHKNLGIRVEWASVPLNPKLKISKKESYTNLSTMRTMQ